MDQLNEMPAYIYGTIGSPQYKKYLELTLSKVNEIITKNKSKKAFDDYEYILKSVDNIDYLILTRNGTLSIFVDFIAHGDVFHINVISKQELETKMLSLKLYLFILKDLNFGEIETGTSLSKENKQFHLKMIDTGIFNLKIRNLKSGETVGQFNDNFKEFLKEMDRNDKNTTFVLSLGNLKESIEDLFNVEYDIIENFQFHISEFLKESSSLTEYLRRTNA